MFCLAVHCPCIAKGLCEWHSQCCRTALCQYTAVKHNRSRDFILSSHDKVLSSSLLQFTALCRSPC